MARATGRLAWMTFCALMALALLAQPAMAFFPLGDVSAQSQELLFYGWALEQFDTSGDGVVDAANDEGLPITFEGGDYGFTRDEMLILTEGFEIWERISTSYAAFRYDDPITEPSTYPASMAGSILDGINYMTIQGEGDPTGDPPIAAPTLAVTYQVFNVDETTIESANGEVITLPGGQTLEADMIFDGTAFRSPTPGVQPTADLLSTVVHEVGHLLGIGHTPMNNLQDGIESAVLASGGTGFIGVTPTMFPSTFLVDDGTGRLTDGGATLAPDDIAAVSWRYPEQNFNSVFFEIAQHAVTRGGTIIPSEPLLGGIVIAWCDVDKNSATPRVPFSSTLTGLYTAGSQNNLDFRGDFVLPALLQAIDIPGGAAPVTADYILTIEPLTSGQFPEVIGAVSALEFDSTHAGGAGVWPAPYEEIFSLEIFKLGGNLRDRDFLNAGTPLRFNPALALIENALSGDPLSFFLSADQAMFGEDTVILPPKDGCAATGTPEARAALSLRAAAGDLLTLFAAMAVLAGPGLLRRLRKRRAVS